MLAKLKSLTRDSLIYGIGHIATRVLTFLLLPYYSFQLTPAEYGELTLYFLFVGVVQSFYSYGLDIAYLRYYSLSKNPKEKRVVTGTTMLTTVATSGFLTLLILLTANTISRWVVHEPVHPEIADAMIRLCAGILAFDTLAMFPFLLLRSTLRPVHFTAVKLLNVTINIGLNIWFLGSLKMSLAGVMWANFIASGATFLVLVPVLLRSIEIKLNIELLREMIRFGLPNIPTYLFVMVIELADRKILELYRGLEEAGLYSAGYKLGMFMAVVTGAFRFAWQPFFLSHAEDKDAKGLFARVLTYYLLVTGFLFLLLSFFIDPIIRARYPLIGHILSPGYWPGLVVFPIILLAHIFDGVYANFMVGVYLKKLTVKLPAVTGIAAAVTILLNILLVPQYGMLAAAWITLLAFFLEALLLWIIVRRHYFVPYEWKRIGKLALAIAAVYGVTLLPLNDSLWLRTGLILMFPVLLYVMRFFDERELYHLRRFGVGK